MTKPNPDDYFGDSKGEAKPKGKRSLNPDDYFGPIEPPKPKAEKPPGLIKRGLAAVGSVLTNPSYAAAADGQRLADAKPDGQRLVSTKPDAKPDEPSAPTDWRGVDEVDAGGGTTPVFQSGQNPTAARGSVLDRPAVAAPPDRMPEEGMLTPEFVRGIRGEFGKIPPEKRFDALRELASGNGVKAMAARIILRDAEAENMRADFARQERPGMVDGLERAMAAPRVPIKAVPGNPPEATVNFPETGALAQWVQQRDAAGVASRHGAARAVADDQRSIDALTQRGQAAASDPDAKAFASENPMTSAVASGAANMLRGLDNIVPTVLDFASNLVGAKTSGAKNQSETSAWLERKAQNLMPEAGQQEMGAAWHKGEFGEWLMLNLAANAPQLAPTLVAAFVPGTQGAALGLLGGIAAGNKYADTGNSAAAVASGMVEGFSERLPLKYFERSAKALSTLPPAIRGKTVQAIGKALPIVGKHLTAQAVVGAIEEVVAQIGNNVIDATILEKDNTLLDGVAEAAVIGAFASGGLSLPQGAGAIRRAAQSPEQHIAQAIDQAAAQFGLNTKAAATLREKIASMDPDAATNYAEKLFAAAERAGLVKKPGGGSAVRQNAKDLAAKAAKDAEAQQGDASGDSVPAGAAASSDTGLADDMDAGAILGTQAEAPQATSGEAPTEGATDGPMTDEPAQSGVEAGTEPPIEGDLTTSDGQPYGTKASARARATRDGGDVVEVLGGWVVRQSQPSNTRGTNAGDINAVSGTGSGPRPGAGGNAQPGSADTSGSGGTGDLVPGELPESRAAGTAGRPVPGAGTGDVPVATGPGAGNNALTALQVTFGGKTYPVESVEDAQRKWEAFRDSADGGGAAGVSQIGNGIRVVDGAGRFVARISYNGRVWDTEDDGPSAGPKPLTAGQSVTIDGKPAEVNDLDGLEAALRKERDSTTSEIENGWINGKGRRQQTPIERAVYDAVTASVLDADAAASIVEMALKEGRPDLALYAAKRAARAADSMSTTPGVSVGSPKYEPIKKNLVESKHKAQADAKSLLEKVTKVASPATTVGMASTKTGDTITIDGKPYTVKSAKPKVLVLTGADGKPRTITSDSATWAKVQPAGDRQADGRQAAGDRQLTTGPISEEFAGQMGEGMAEHVAQAQQKRLAKERPELEWTVADADPTRNPKLKADRYVVQGRAPVAQAKPDQEAAPARSVEPAGAPAEAAVPAAGSAAVEADGLKKSKSKPPKEKKAKAVMGSWPLGYIVHSLGGIGMSLRADLSRKEARTRTNRKTGKVTHYTDWRGNGLLFRKTGSTDLTEMAQILEEAGYLEPGLVKRDYLEATSQVQDIIKAEINNPGSTEPTYSEDFDEMMQRQADARADAERDDALIKSFSVDDMEEAGGGEYDAEQQAVFAQLAEEAEALGIDVDNLREQFYDESNPEWSQKEYDQALTEALKQAIARVAGQAPGDDASGARDGGQGGVEADPVASGAGSDRADGPDQAVQAEGLTGKDLFGARPEDVGSAKQDLEAKRKALVDLEDRIVSLAGLAPGFVENALRSRKVPKALKDERDQLREDIRQMREQVAKLDMPVKDMEAYIKVAADSIAELRKTDVYRVLVESNRAALRKDIATYIKANRPDLAKEVDDVLAEQDAEAAPALTLTAESEADAQAKAKREADALAAEQKAKADEQARLKREANKREADARAAAILAEREAAKKAEVDAAADDFALGQEPPKPVDKKVDAKDLAGQKDIFGGATPFADPLTLTERQLNSLRGKPITMKAQTEDGQVASWEIDAAEAVQSLRSREATIQQLVRCLS